MFAGGYDTRGLFRETGVKCMRKPKILVVGSMNMDLFVRDCNALPAYGQSIISRD